MRNLAKTRLSDEAIAIYLDAHEIKVRAGPDGLQALNEWAEDGRSEWITVSDWSLRELLTWLGY